MKKLAVVLVALSFALTSCSGIFSGTPVEVNQTNTSYLDYSADVLANTQGNKVLFFHASWCGSCANANKAIAESVTTTDLTIFKVDYDSSEDLRKKYEVMKQHTFVQVDSEGTMITKWSGSKSVADIQSQLKEYEEPKVETIKEESQKIEEVKEMDDTTSLDEGSQEAVLEELESSLNELELDTETIEKTVSIQNEESTKSVEVVSVEETVEVTPVAAVEVKEAGKFVPFTTEAVAATTGTKVLFFHASWCGSCNSAANEFTSESAPDELSIFDVDYDSNIDLRKQYGVTTQHTFVQIDENGKMLKRWFGSRNYGDILNELQS
ncbi:MAG: thioredoxin family protein [Candidatus Gracilibacteria bacterium]|nr:thioredoxin family protein [Candidatus Gracilibacteria bacterium]